MPDIQKAIGEIKKAESKVSKYLAAIYSQESKPKLQDIHDAQHHFGLAGQYLVMSVADSRRLAAGEDALNLPEPENETEREMQVGQIGSALAALQSTDDLGPYLNKWVDDAMQKLLAKRTAMLGKQAAL